MRAACGVEVDLEVPTSISDLVSPLSSPNPGATLLASPGGGPGGGSQFLFCAAFWLPDEAAEGPLLLL